MAGTVTFFDQTAKEFADRVHISNVLGSRPGNIYYVSSVNGSTNNAGTSAEGPKATLAQALELCSNGRNDTVIVLPGHAETLATTTAGVTVSKSGINIIGMGNGRNRPAFTAGAAAIDAFQISAANVRIENIRVIGATSCTALFNLGGTGLTATDLSLNKCSLEHGAAPLIAVTVTEGASRFSFKDCIFLGTAAGPDNAIKFEYGDIDEWEVVRCQFIYTGSAGIDEGVIQSSFQTKGYRIVDCIMVCVDTLMIDFNSSSTTGATHLAGICSNLRGTFTSPLTSTEDGFDEGPTGCVGISVTDDKSKHGARVPIVTAS